MSANFLHEYTHTHTHTLSSYLNINWLPEYVAQHTAHKMIHSHTASYWLKLSAVPLSYFALSVCMARSIRLFASHPFNVKILESKATAKYISWRSTFSKWKTNSNVFDCCRTNDNQRTTKSFAYYWCCVCARVCVTFLAHVRTGSNNQHHGNDYCEAYHTIPIAQSDETLLCVASVTE